MRDILKEIWEQYKIYNLVGRNILHITYNNRLASKYRQHILSLAKVGKLCYSVAAIYVKSVYLNLFLGGRA
jgi:hypothetical protein